MIQQQNEYGRLEKVIVCPPKYMEIKKIINETQKFYEDSNIDVSIAVKQHQELVDVLEKHGVEIIELYTDPKLNEQVFTRDIGFVIDDILYTAEMGRNIRKPEIDVLQQILDEHAITYHPLTTQSIEGGDVMVTEDIVWIGNSSRTTSHAIQELQTHIGNREIVELPIRQDILHLDCALNMVSKEVGLIYSPAFHEEDVKKLHDKYDLIEVNEDEQFTLGTNVFSIGDQKVISLPDNKQVNQALIKKGFDVIEVDFSEIIKSGGSFRCCTLPIERK
ncbi:NG,NG-dimethylarginine dimethylaminohydrolase [Gracilibacillus boraciitolerans JCM 21714]|uniref:NG,NG-dimethylarginine dimethylaminohydrolase n=1 Tax=Gracilibacillus boraciitolerans JCM 21714 TaxID=1298598 RepID=W4VQY9_9BACI|nr:arginine deiminase family protein [Gracilibacillus boraciitolerans]GAE95394.1 NG,NG-dimethylarginine dimethylaminohydrolase [Gracilibacillus boraciitolerans JCM 21714]